MLRQDIGGARVGLGAFVGADVRVDGFADNRVRKLEALARRQDRQRGQEIRIPCRLLLRNFGEARGLGEARAVAEHRHGAHQSGRRRRGSGETQEHRLGHGPRTDVLLADRLARVGRELLLACLAQERFEEEGVAAGGFVASRREVLCDFRTEPSLAKRGGRLDAQRSRPDDLCAGTGGQPCDVRPHRLAASGRRQNGEREAVQAGGQVVEESNRFRIGPVEVVD